MSESLNDLFVTSPSHFASVLLLAFTGELLKSLLSNKVAMAFSALLVHCLLHLAGESTALDVSIFLFNGAVSISILGDARLLLSTSTFLHFLGSLAILG
jgi:hypothetical protein